MKITNKNNLPAVVYRAIVNDDYDPGHGDISATTLISPPQIRALSKLHDNELEEDASDRGWSLLGQAIHSVLERGASPTDTVEKRLYADVDGTLVSGQLDLLDDKGILTDFKVTSAYSVLNGCKREWTEQLNILDYLCYRNEITVKKANILAILRDWSKHGKRRNPNYPDNQFTTIAVNLWPHSIQELFIKEKIIEHNQAPRQCTSEEMWQKPAVYAVMKVNRKSALRLFPTDAEAQSYIKSSNPSTGLYVQYRAGELTRCAGYCPVANFCAQYKGANK